MIGSTLQVKTRADDSSWQESVALQELTDPDYSSIPHKPPHVGIVIRDSKSSVSSKSSSHASVEIIKKKLAPFFQGFLYSIGAEPDTSVSWPHAVLIAVLVALFYWILAWGSLYFIYNEFASVWPPNGVYVGGCLQSSPRVRRVLVVTIGAAIYTVNIAWGNEQLKAFVYMLLNSLEALLITSISVGLINVFLPKKLSLLYRKHLISLGVGIFAGCAITGLLVDAYWVNQLSPSDSFGDLYIKYIGRNIVGSALTVPVVLATPIDGKLRNLPKTCWHFLRTHPNMVVQAFALLLLLVAIPTLSAILIKASTLSAVGGLYITSPVVLYAAGTYGTAGAAYASLVVGFASAVSTLVFSVDSISPFAKNFSAQDQLIWLQLFLVVLIGTSLFFVVILAERDKARANVENKVHQRTEELTNALAQLDDALRKAETADNDKAVFFSFLCHELRNPLHVISNMANFLEDGHHHQHQETNLPHIKAIRSSTKYMLALVSDVLDLGRFEAGRVVLENLPVDIHTLLQSNFDCAAQLADGHQISFDWEIDSAVPQLLSVDSVRLQQILNNLISNAFKFTPKGGKIRVDVRASKFFRGSSFQAAVDVTAADTSLSTRPVETHRRHISTDLLRRVVAATTNNDKPDNDNGDGAGDGAANSAPPSPNAGNRKTSKKKAKRNQPRHHHHHHQHHNNLHDDYFDIVPCNDTTDGAGNALARSASQSSVLIRSQSSYTIPHNTATTTNKQSERSAGSCSCLPNFRKPYLSVRSRSNKHSPPPPPTPLHDCPPSPLRNDDATTTANASVIIDSSKISRSSSSSSSCSGGSTPVPLSEPSLSPSTSSQPSPTAAASDMATPILTTADTADAGQGEWVVLEVSVSDTGIGIDPSIVSKLFRPYAQAAVSTMREYGGSGLGLAITNQIVRLMGGSVYVETDVGKGSKFTFVVPLLIVKEASTPTDPSPPPEMISPLSPAIRHPTPPPSSAILNLDEIRPLEEEPPPPPQTVDDNFEPPSVLRILIVDDSSINRTILFSMIKKVMEKGTYAVEVATNGQEAVDMCQQANNLFDLIFMDIVMPVMNGWDACKRIRENGFLKQIVITTANQVTGDAVAEVYAAGANDAIGKPFSKEHIHTIISKIDATMIAVNVNVAKHQPPLSPPPPPLPCPPSPAATVSNHHVIVCAAQT